jgi:NADPH:quinone reductase-like Zn-dependent oxidoreductase
MSIFPFILRGVSLIGVSSQNYPKLMRIEMWNKLANEWKPENLMDLYQEIGLEDIKSTLDLILLGKLKGRTIVNMLN